MINEVLLVSVVVKCCPNTQLMGARKWIGKRVRRKSECFLTIGGTKIEVAVCEKQKTEN